MNYGLLRIDRSGNVGRVLIVDVADERTASARARDFAGVWAVDIRCGDLQIASLSNTAGLIAPLALCR